MKDNINDLINSILTDVKKPSQSTSYDEQLKRSTENTASAWKAIGHMDSTVEQLNSQLQKQAEELKKLAEEMEKDRIMLPGEAESEEKKSIEQKTSSEPKKSPAEIEQCFKKVQEALDSELIGQQELKNQLMIAFKRPFVTGTDPDSALNTILVSGGEGTGKHTAVKLITKTLAKGGVISSGECISVNMELYPSQDEADIFLHDLYIALEAPARVLIFDNVNKAHPSIVMMLGEMISEKVVNLSGRYVAQKGILVDSGKALTKEAVSTFSVKGQYIVIISESSPIKLSELFGTGLMNSLGDICQSGAFSEQDIDKIARLRFESLVKRAKENLSIELTSDEELIKCFVSSLISSVGVHGVVDFENKCYRALCEYKLKYSPAQSISVKLAGSEDPCLIVGEKEQIKFSSLLPQPSTVQLEQVKAEINEIVGLGEVKEYILSLENNFAVQKRRAQAGLKTENTSMHMIFTGNPGTGKTTMARLVAKYLKAVGILSGGQLIEVTRSDLVGRYVGHTAPLTTSVIKSAYGGVLFIDEAYSLYRSESDSYGLEAIDTIVKCMEEYRDEMVFILAGYTKEMSQFLTANSGLKSRFPNIIEFPDYTAEELTQIAFSIAKSKGYEIEERCLKPMKKYFNTVQTFNAREAGNGRLARNKVEEAILNQAKRIVGSEEESLSLLMTEDFDFDSMPV